MAIGSERYWKKEHMERTFPETKAGAVALPLTWSLKSQSIILLHSMGDKRVSKASPGSRQ